MLPPVELTAAPDLVSNQLIPPSCIKAGKSQKVQFTVRNQGLIPSGTFQVALYLSQDSKLSADDNLVGTTAISNLNPGVSLTMTAPINSPATLAPAKQMFLLEVIDPANSVDESDEGNNVLPAPVLTCG